MEPKLLDTVLLACDLPEHGLSSGARGTVVEDFGSAYEVEFVDDESGETIALVTIGRTNLVLQTYVTTEEFEVNCGVQIHQSFVDTTPPSSDVYNAEPACKPLATAA